MKKLILLKLIILYCIPGISQINMVGEKAPTIDIKKWIYPKIKTPDWQCREVPKELTGRTIILDFWFTKCAPCVASIPQLNLLAKNNPEIVFISVTFDNEKVIDQFLDKMIMNYPVGIDTEQQIINAFNVSAFPETFLIDKNGIIQWQGSTFHLNSQKLNELLDRDQPTQNINYSNQELPINNSAYSFSIQEHTLEMGQSSYYHFNPFDINVFNKDLESILKTFYGINKSRILTNNSILLKTSYDLTLMADKEITTHANCVEMLKYLLPEYLNLKLEKVYRDTLVGILTIENDSLLAIHKSTVNFFGTSMRYDNWEAQGATLAHLKDFVEDNYSKIVVVEKDDERKFNFIIPANTFIEAKEALLNEYGLIIKTKKIKTEFWEIKKNKQHAYNSQ